MSSVPPSERSQLVLSLARVLHQSGIPAHRLEELLERLAGQLGMEGQFYCTPTAIIASFGGERTHLMRVAPGSIDLAKQRRIDALVAEILQGSLDARHALEMVQEIQGAPPRHGPPATVVAFGAASSGVAAVLGGAPVDILAAGIAGLLVGLLALLAARSLPFLRVFEAVAALCATAIALSAQALWPSANAMTVMMAGLIVLIPGLTLTVALTELATDNLVAGTARLASAAVVFIKLGFGVAVGVTLADSLGMAFTLRTSAGVPLWVEPLAIVVVGVALTVLFRAAWGDMFWVLLGCAVATAGAKVGIALLGPQLGAFAGALLVGVLSNLVARWRKQPGSLTLIPGVLLLVPGSLGFRSFTALLREDVSSGIEGAFTMFLIAISLVAGLLMANLLAHPRRAL